VPNMDDPSQDVLVGGLAVLEHGLGCPRWAGRQELGRHISVAAVSPFLPSPSTPATKLLDSGSPATISLPPTPPSNTHTRQVGLVSGGAGDCGGPALPTVFQAVSPYVPWVEAALDSVDTLGHLPQGEAAPGDKVPDPDGGAHATQQQASPAAPVATPGGPLDQVYGP